MHETPIRMLKYWYFLIDPVGLATGPCMGLLNPNH